ncbi:MAG: ATP-binding protein [Myxococcales bacterium]|nr:MAG: ATP-binding protein [Myxococcales bacterium]
MSLIRTIALAPRLEDVGRVAEELAEAVCSRTVDEDLHFRVDLALTEALTNAIIHGCESDVASVTVRYERNGGRHVFQISDPGPGPDPAERQAAAMADDLLKEHRRGLPLIHWAADGVVYSREADGFRLTLNFLSRKQ